MAGMVAVTAAGVLVAAVAAAEVAPAARCWPLHRLPVPDIPEHRGQVGAAQVTALPTAAARPLPSPL